MWASPPTGLCEIDPTKQQFLWVTAYYSGRAEIGVWETICLASGGDVIYNTSKATPLRWELRASTDLLPHYAVLP